MPKVSVIVPVFKVENYIERCIRSIQGQTLTEWELILVDDCSPDKCFEIMSQYAKDDPRIIVKRHEANHGPMIARRWGDELANGDYITYCDGDDTLPKNALQTLYETAIRTGADIVSGNYTYVKTDGSHVDRISKMDKGIDGEALLRAVLRRQMTHILCSKLFKAELIKGHQYEVIDHMTNAEDGYLFYQMIPYVKKVVQLQDVVYYYMQSPDSSSQRRYSEKAIENILLMNTMRISLIKDFPQLKKEILCFVSDVLNGLIIEGYDKDGLLSKLMKKYDLVEYSKIQTVLTTHSPLDSVKLIIRRILS